MIFSSLSSSSFFCLGIILVIIGILGYLISRKFQEQNHKITTMCELVTTMAQDLQMLKMQNAVDKIQHSLQNQSLASAGGSTLAAVPSAAAASTTDPAASGHVSVGGSGMSRKVDMLGYLGEAHKIVVSDDEASFSDSDDADDEGEDEDDTSTLEEFEADVFDLDDGGEEESDDNIEITEIVELSSVDSPEEVLVEVEEVDTEKKIERYTVKVEPDEVAVETKHIELMMDPVDHVILSTQTNLPHFEPSPPPVIVVNKLDANESPVPFVLEEEEEQDAEQPTNPSTPATVLAALGGNPNTKPKKPTKQSRSMVLEEGTIENMEDFNGDYSKLNVTQLKNLVTFRGLSSHASKLKKTELLQLLAGGGGGGSMEVTEISLEM